MNIALPVPIDMCAWPLLTVLANLLGLSLFGPSWLFSSAVAVLMTLLVLFFRDPETEPPAGPIGFVSPTDGVVTGIRLNGQPGARNGLPS